MTVALGVALAVVTLGSLLAFVVQGRLHVRSLAAEARQNARERDLRLNQMMHLMGHTWTPPPAHEEREAPEPRVTVRSPEQYPDHDFQEA